MMQRCPLYALRGILHGRSGQKNNTGEGRSARPMVGRNVARGVSQWFILRRTGCICCHNAVYQMSAEPLGRCNRPCTCSSRQPYSCTRRQYKKSIWAYAGCSGDVSNRKMPVHMAVFRGLGKLLHACSKSSSASTLLHACSKLHVCTLCVTLRHAAVWHQQYGPIEAHPTREKHHTRGVGAHVGCPWDVTN